MFYPSFLLCYWHFLSSSLFLSRSADDLEQAVKSLQLGPSDIDSVSCLDCMLQALEQDGEYLQKKTPHPFYPNTDVYYSLYTQYLPKFCEKNP